MQKVSSNGIHKKTKVDPFSDSNLLTKFAHEVEKLAHTIEAFDKKSLNGPTNLDLKWRELLDIQVTLIFHIKLYPCLYMHLVKRTLST